MQPTARTLQWIRKLDWPIDVVERWVGPPGNFAMRKRRDLFGFIDLIALDGKPGCLGIQSTASSGMSARVTKIHEQCFELSRRWLHAGNRLWVVGWAKRGKQGERKLWTVNVQDISLDPNEPDVTVVTTIPAPMPPPRERAPRKRKSEPESTQRTFADVDSFQRDKEQLTNELGHPPFWERKDS